MSENTESDGERTRDAGFDDWLDAARANEAYSLVCEAGHHSLPPRRVCPECGSTDLTEEPLPETGEVETVTVTHVATPSFEADAPYATAIADFGPVRLTGQVVEVDPETVEPGLAVEIAVTTSETSGKRIVGFRPVQ
ncbi:Zn-ribbon domain-containing OB-fold protein [Natronolimnobius baerhuensis]|uniref:Nucleic acid-binding protein n=1 Tax=Natronolimnobius baerhuensis TaxID=253108 RepID=A0A202E8M5_9EURY|nr:OB-fold domain-containing protein [Natronolimnobius baerhuensis]OVE84615.1 nucleic acid-binding protein [Natronolimnobius baerhuensis]